MRTPELESADLFTPGRSSYVTSVEDGSFQLHLTPGASYRAHIAATVFEEDFHTTAVFAGGYPGVAQNWPPEHVPAEGNKEADLLAEPLIARLTHEGWTEDAISARVLRQGESNNSIGDVAASVETGFLNPDAFHTDVKHGIHLVTGVLHGIRFRDILSKALDIDPRLVRRVPMHDIYSTPATEFRPPESASITIAKQFAAIVMTRRVLRDVRPGDLQGLRDAEQRFNAVAAKSV